MIFEGANTLSKTFIFYGRRIWDHPGKRRILYFFHKLFSKQLKVKSPNGAVLQLIPVDYISGKILFHKTYEPLSLKLALELLADSDGDFLDVGANVGLYTSIIAKSYPGKQIISIEPEENNFKLLTKNIAGNLPNKVIALNIAVGENAGLIQMELPVVNNAGAFRVKTEGLSNPIKTKYYPMLNLKTVLKELGVNNIGLFKIDVEGYEMEVFKGMDWTAAYKPKHIIMEYTDYVGRTGTSSDSVLDYLTKQGYKAYSVEKKPYTKGDDLPEDNLWLSLI